MKKLSIQRKWCKGCRVCVTFCPKNVLAVGEEEKVYAKNPEDCIFCGVCALRCPELAIEVGEELSEEAITCGWKVVSEKA